MSDKARIDQWLWATRIYKTRSQAAEACRGGKVQIDGEPVKPAHAVKPGERVAAQKDGVLRELVVVAPLVKRVGAERVKEFLEDRTPPERLEQARVSFAQRALRREPGAGRPTKKERRDMERLFEMDE